jgi:tripartite-type tricarboxylate transporter receptor subunit TctC
VASPPGTPAAIQNILSDALARALKDPKVVAWAAENDIVMNPKTPQQTAALVARERAFFERWKNYLKL